jgi:hypothetical protein
MQSCAKNVLSHSVRKLLFTIVKMVEAPGFFSGNNNASMFNQIQM